MFAIIYGPWQPSLPFSITYWIPCFTSSFWTLLPWLFSPLWLFKNFPLVISPMVSIHLIVQCIYNSPDPHLTFTNYLHSHNQLFPFNPELWLCASRKGSKDIAQLWKWKSAFVMPHQMECYPTYLWNWPNCLYFWDTAMHCKSWWFWMAWKSPHIRSRLTL